MYANSEVIWLSFRRQVIKIALVTQILLSDSNEPMPILLLTNIFQGFTNPIYHISTARFTSASMK